MKHYDYLHIPDPENKKEITSRLWYNKYLYKSMYFIPGIYILRQHYTENEIKTHIQTFENSAWKATLLKNVITKYNENEKIILNFAKILQPYRYNKTVFLRIAEPSISIFTNNIEIHEKIIKIFNNFLHVDCRPELDAIPFLLNSKNTVIVKELPYNRYRYKVIINNYTNDHIIPKQLLDWGFAQDSAVRFSSKTIKYFNKPQLWLDQGFMYIEDETTLMMCKMFLTKCPNRIIKYVVDSEL